MFDFKNKKIYIAPHTPKTTAFKEEFVAENDVVFQGFLDKFKEGEDIFKPQKIANDFDYILILSQNHFDSIYAQYKQLFSVEKLIKVAIVDGEYLYLDHKQIKKEQKQNRVVKLQRAFLHFLTKLLDGIGYKRKGVLFISKSFVGTNNKALYLHCIREGKEVCITTDNRWQYKELHKHGLPAVWLGSWKSYLYMALARTIVQDQGNFTHEINLLSPKQTTVQLWHGIPLKRMNKLVGVKYDYLISTSDFVNETTLGKVIEAKEYKNYGHPRNDLLLKKELEQWDELFCDEKLLEFAKNKKDVKLAVYMPTHRDSSSAAKPPLDFEALNQELEKIDTYLIIKMHPFVLQLYKQDEYKSYTNILFHSPDGDIYPLLRYCDVLVSDYSSVYFDFMLLGRPIIFFDYDKEEYERNIGGFVYDYEEFTPGVKVKMQGELVEALQSDMDFNYGMLSEKLTYHIDAKSSLRIFNLIYKSTIMKKGEDLNQTPN